MSNVEVRQVVAGPFSIGEGPHWEEGSQSLLFVDIMSCDLHRYFPETKRHQVLHINDCGTGKTVSFAVPLEDDPNLLVVGLGRSIAIVEWSPNDPDEKTVKAKAVLHTVDEQAPKNRFNDAKCDPNGRLWAGTMGHEIRPAELEFYTGSLFSLDSKLALKMWVSKVSISNGLAWSQDKKIFYYIDSIERSVDAFDYNHSTGEIGNRRKVFDYSVFGKSTEVPDGMCSDGEGNLWVANFFGKKVICIDPRTGKLLRTIAMPAENMTSVCWGGKNYDTLFATSAAQAGIKSAGATFAITGLGVKGQKPDNFKFDLQLLKTKLTE